MIRKFINWLMAKYPRKSTKEEAKTVTDLLEDYKRYARDGKERDN